VREAASRTLGNRAVDLMRTTQHEWMVKSQETRIIRTEALPVLRETRRGKVISFSTPTRPTAHNTLVVSPRRWVVLREPRGLNRPALLRQVRLLVVTGVSGPG
jgi:hypothetical protein